MAGKTKKPYWEKLKDPRWQRKRLEILERDGFACVACGANDRTLHVHHGVYRKGLEPWEADDDTLWTLCEACHEYQADFLSDIQLEIGRLNPKLYGNFREAIRSLREYAEQSPTEITVKQYFDEMIAEEPHGAEIRKRLTALQQDDLDILRNAVWFVLLNLHQA